MKKIIALVLTLTMIVALTVAVAPTAMAEDKIPLKISHHPYFHGLPTTYAIENGLYDAFDYTVDYYAGGP